MKKLVTCKVLNEYEKEFKCSIPYKRFEKSVLKMKSLLNPIIDEVYEKMKKGGK